MIRQEHRLSRRGVLRNVAIVAIGIATSGNGSMAMAARDRTDLKWEWPADRTPTRVAVARVTSFKKQGGGLFGFKKSPSIAGNLPQAHILEGEWIGGAFEAGPFRLVLPLPEIGQVEPGARLAIAMLDTPVCICIRAIPPHVTDRDALAWSEEFACS